MKNVNKNKLLAAFVASLLLSASYFTPANAAEYSGIAITDVSVNGEGSVVYAKPGATIGVHAHYKLLWPREQNSIVQIIVGLDGIGAQTTIANGIVIGDRYYDHHPLVFRRKKIDITEKDVDFTLIAPEASGTYDVRFRYAQAYLPNEAISWWGVDQNPTEDASIATIIVSE